MSPRGAADYWPGMTRLWWRGDVTGLVLALAFAVLWNLLVVGRIWQEWISPSVQQTLAVGLVTLWCWGVWDARQFRRGWERNQQTDEQLDLFLSARREYLRGQRDVAERNLGRLLQLKPDDIEARLLLVTLLRRIRRVDEAKEQLRRLQRWRDAGKWNLEIRREWELLARLETLALPVVKTQRHWDFRAARSRDATTPHAMAESNDTLRQDEATPLHAVTRQEKTSVESYSEFPISRDVSMTEVVHTAEQTPTWPPRTNLSNDGHEWPLREAG